MHIADSIGPGGIFRSLRNTPVVASVARDSAELAPGAWILNYTNPATAIATAARRPGRPVHVALLVLAAALRPGLAGRAGGRGGGRGETPVPVGGINHCTGILSLRLRDGRDAIPLVAPGRSTELVRWVIDTFGVLPYCWAHWAEFFPQLQRLEEPYGGRAQGLPMRYGRRIYDMDDQRERVQVVERLAGAGRPPTGRARTARDLPHGPEDDGIVVVDVMASVIETRGDGLHRQHRSTTA